MKVKILTLCATLSIANIAFAGTYEYQDTVIKMDIKKGVISSQLCEKKQCDDADQDVESLVSALEERITQSQKSLSDKDKLMADALKIATSKEAYIVKDETTDKEYVMVSFGKSFNLPIPRDDVKKKNMALVVSAMEANTDRYTRVLKMLKSGKLPSDFKTLRYGEISSMTELHNVIKFAEYM
jgi:hypothetical protein